MTLHLHFLLKISVELFGSLAVSHTISSTIISKCFRFGLWFYMFSHPLRCEGPSCSIFFMLKGLNSGICWYRLCIVRMHHFD